jgi:prepilin-type N-terminal cleavage/methylation domain-containing protein
MRAAATIARVRRGEEGFTLVEMMIAVALLGVVLAIFLTTFAVIQTAASREDQRSRNNDQARLAVEELDREIRSGNVLFDPAKENNGITSCTGCLPGYTLRVYTQSNYPTRGSVCRLWRITDTGDLQTRSWPPPNSVALATPWLTVASGIANRQANRPAFSLEPTLERTVDIFLLVNANYVRQKEESVTIQVSVTGRNTAQLFPENVCLQTPPDSS